MLLSSFVFPFIVGWSVYSVDSKTLTSTLTSTSTVVVPSSTQIPSSYNSDSDFRSSILNSTNHYRKQHNATQVKWNETLAVYARIYAAKCLWSHSVIPSTLLFLSSFKFSQSLILSSIKGGPSGENLAEGYPNTTASVEAWGNERSRYRFNPPSGFSKKTGHFTQLVWKATKSVGCARVNCNDGTTDGDAAHGWFVICEYWPPGNVEGEYKSQVQKQIKRAQGTTERKRPSWLPWLGLLAVAMGCL